MDGQENSSLVHQSVFYALVPGSIHMNIWATLIEFSGLFLKDMKLGGYLRCVAGKVGLERVGDEYEQDTLNKCSIWNFYSQKLV